MNKKIFIDSLLFLLLVAAFSYSPGVFAQSVPQISYLSISGGKAGTEVTVVGSGFTAGSLVVFGSGAVSPSSVSKDGTRLVFVVPASLVPLCKFRVPPCDDSIYAPAPGTYLVRIAADSSFVTLSNSVRFDLLPRVAITGISPASGPVGTEVTITGYGFSEFANAINFGSVGVIPSLGDLSRAGSTSTLSGTGVSSIKFVVPQEIMPQCMFTYPPCPASRTKLAPGSYSVSVSPNFDFSQILNRTSNSVTFTVTLGEATTSKPTIRDISASSGSVGTEIVIRGTNFSPNLNAVLFESVSGAPIGVTLLQPKGDGFAFVVPASLYPVCAIFGDPVCQVSAPNIALPPGTYTIRVMRDAKAVSDGAQFIVTAISAPASLPAATGTFAPGSRVGTAVNLNVRSSPSLSASIVGVAKSGSLGGVLSGPANADGYEWFQISWENGLLGWSVGNRLVGRGLSSCPVQVGRKIYVVAGDRALIFYLREYPSVNAPIVSGQLPVVGGRVVDGPVIADKYYWWKLRFDDGAVGWGKESDFVVTDCYDFAAPPPPPQALTVSLSSPLAGASLSGTVPITASVPAGANVSEVSFYANGVILGRVSAPPYVWNWNVSRVLNGSYSLYAEARDGGFIAKSDTVFVQVVGGISAPRVTLTSPQAGTTVSGAVPVAASVSADTPVSQVEFMVDGVVKSTVKSPPYSWVWDSSQEYNGWHSLGAVARAEDVPPGLASPISVQVTGGKEREVLPTVEVFFITPDAGSTVSGAITITAGVSSTAPVTSVDFYDGGIGGKFIGSAKSAPYTVTWDTRQVLNGVHLITAVASAGQVSGNRSITVNVTGGLSVPQVTFISPQSGSTVSGSVTLSVSVPANNPPVTEVYFLKNGILSSVVKSSPYVWTWNSAEEYNGRYSLWAVAKTTDPTISGSGGIWVDVTGGKVVPAAPSITVSFTDPKAGADVWGTVKLAASVVSSVSISRVDFYVDGSLLGTATNSPYTVSWDTASVQQGQHTVLAVARAESASASQSISVNVLPPPVFAVGDRIKVKTDSNFGLNVRTGPSKQFSIIGSAPNGSLGTIVSGPVFAETMYWWKVQYDSGLTGWSVEPYMVAP